MDFALLATIAVTGFSVAFVHAALPTHWLPFVLAGRGQRWSETRTLTVTALAGGGHVLFTVALGVLVAWLGIEVDRWTGEVFPWIAGGVLFVFGGYYWFRGGHSHFGAAPAHGRPHEHSHAGDDHHHAHPHVDPHARSAGSALFVATGRNDRAVIVGLVAALTFSPCEGFLPVFVAGARYGWPAFALLCAILAIATLAGMLLFTHLTLRGIRRFDLGALERFEGRILGGMLIALGVAVVALETAR